MPEGSSAFGRHCLVVVGRIGETLPSFGGSSSDRTFTSPVHVHDVVRVASTALALRRMWSAFTNDAEDERRAFSLKPKVGAHKVAVNFTVRW
jgi:hypothetical protein